MRAPNVGQVLVTSSGQKLFVVEVTLVSEPGEPDGFIVSFVRNESDIEDMNAHADELNQVEFDELCKEEGIRY